MQYILIFGNPVDGLEHVGPFDDAAAAGDYAEDSLSAAEDWWIVLLQAPAYPEGN
jgi:hypothetical protein